MEILGSIPDAVRFVIVFLLILGLLAPLLWRRFNFGPLRRSGPRGRRLSVVETAAVDVRHRLVLVRRDNVEHLLLIGGASDVIVESNVVRTGLVAREPRPIPDARPEAARQAVAETPDWSLPLEPVARPVRTVDLDAALPEPPARTAREAMVDSMRAVRSVAAARRGPPMDFDNPPEEIAAPARTPSPSPAEVNHRPAPEPRRAPPEPKRPQTVAPEPPLPPGDAPPEPKRERAPAAPRPVQAVAAPAGNTIPPPPRPVQSAAVAAAGNPPPPVQPVPGGAPAGPAPSPHRQASSDEGNFAEMAQRLEAALRRPTAAKAEPTRPPPAGRRPSAGDAAGPAKSGVKSPEPPAPDLKILSGKGKNESALDSLEDEMARMLGRPGKS